MFRSSYQARERQVGAVEGVLEAIGAAGCPMIIALNKVDLLPAEAAANLNGVAATLPSVQVSALIGTGVDDLLCCISAALQTQFVALDVLIPYDRGDLVALFHQYGTIEQISYEERGTHLRGRMPTNHSGQFAAFACRRETSKK